MLHKKWVGAMVFSLLFFSFIASSTHPAQAAQTCTSTTGLTTENSPRTCSAYCASVGGTFGRSGICSGGSCYCTNSTVSNCDENWQGCSGNPGACSEYRWCREGNSVWYQIQKCTCPGSEPTSPPPYIPPTAPPPVPTDVPPIPTLPATTVAPNCPKKPHGDANCDGVISYTDYSIFLLKMRGQQICTNCSADFNSDGKTNIADYEIWRNSVYH